MQNDYLEKYIETHGAFLGSVASVSSLCFAGSAFFLARGLGVIRDDKVGPVRMQWMLFLALVSSVISMLAGFFAEGQLASFYEDLFKNAPSSGCAFAAPGAAEPLGREAAYFQSCIRPRLSAMNLAALLSALVAITSLTAWLIVQARGRK